MMNQIRLTVGGINYTVKSDESAEYLNELGDELELRLRRIVRRNPTMSTTMAAIMAALEASDEAKKARAELEQLKKQLEKPGHRQKNPIADQRQMKFGDK